MGTTWAPFADRSKWIDMGPAPINGRKYLGKLGLFHSSKWVFPKIRVPQNGWFVMENPIKTDNLGGKTTPIFGSTPKWSYYITPDSLIAVWIFFLDPSPEVWKQTLEKELDLWCCQQLGGKKGGKICPFLSSGGFSKNRAFSGIFRLSLAGGG